MGGSEGCGGPAVRSFLDGAALAAVALILSGCGPVANVGLNLYSSGEALATIAKQAMEDEGGNTEEAGDDPE